MIHRAPFGSLERFVGLLIEHFEGKFPVWLAPEQVRVLSISEKHNSYADMVTQRLKDAGVRVSSDVSDDKVGAKIRLARLDRIPYMLITGAREEESQSVSVRHRDREDLGTMTLNDFVDQVCEEIRNRSL
jgi:threonyl-tRNA synthetase